MRSVAAGQLGDCPEAMLGRELILVRIPIEAHAAVGDDDAAKPAVNPLLVLGADFGAKCRAVGVEALIANLQR